MTSTTSAITDTKECSFCAETLKAGIEPDLVLDLLARLVDKSLAFYDEDEQGNGRYRLLETVRQYARDRLLESGEGQLSRERHRGYYLQFAEQSAPKLAGAEQRVHLDRLETEHDNFRVALDWGQGSCDAAAAQLRLSAALWRFWDVRGHLSEGRQRYADALADEAAQGPSKARADALQGAGILARHQGDYAAADQLFQECVAIRRLLGDQGGVALALNNLGANAYDRGEYPPARACFEESLALRRNLGNKPGIAATLLNLGNLLHDQGSYPAARALYEESLSLYRELSDLGNVAIALTNLGNLAKNQGDLASARPLYEESLALARRLDDRWCVTLALVNLGPLLCALGEYAASRCALAECLTLCRQMGLKRLTAFALEGFAELAMMEKRAERALTLYAAAHMLRNAIGSPLTSGELAQVQRNLAMLRADMGENPLKALWAKGEAINLEQAIVYALAPENGATQ